MGTELSPARRTDVGQAGQLLADLPQRSGLPGRVWTVQRLLGQRKLGREASGAGHSWGRILFETVLIGAQSLQTAKAFSEPYNGGLARNAGLQEGRRTSESA